MKLQKTRKNLGITGITGTFYSVAMVLRELGMSATAVELKLGMRQSATHSAAWAEYF